MRLAELVGTLSMAADAGAGMPDHHALRGAIMAARAIAHFADLKCRYTRGHSTGVAALAGAAARKLELGAQIEKTVSRAGLWPAKTLLTYHDPPGHSFSGDGRAALEAAVRSRGQLLS